MMILSTGPYPSTMSVEISYEIESGINLPEYDGFRLEPGPGVTIKV
jgi:hypothetical protein